MTDTTDLIQRLRRHRGDYIEEMDEAADALEQQAAQIEALQLTKAGLIDSLREEMDEGLRLRELGGALPDENITAMTERIIGERAAQAAQIAEKDAEIARLTECLSKANANHEHFERAWYLRGDEVEVLRAERDHARETVENAMKLLVGIHALLNPPPVVAGGSVYRFDNPNANDVLQLLSDRIRDVPHHLAVLDAALRQEQPNHFPDAGKMVQPAGEQPT